jgi:predicted transposase YdaD
MKYDITAKVIMDIAKESIVHRFLDIDIADVEAINNIPEETVSLKRSDFPFRVILKNGKQIIVLIEVQTRFNHNFILRLIDYTIRFKIKYRLRIIPLVLLFTPSRKATGIYKDELITFNYNIVKFWELQAKEFMNDIYLYPFLPIMKGGEELIVEAENRIYNEDMDIDKKADLLTAMAIFAGMKDKNLASQLIERRRDIMIQSAAYGIIKEEGRKEGLQEGLSKGIEEGIEKGLEKGLEKGKQEGLYETISLGLELKFGEEGLKLVPKVLKIKSVRKLSQIKNAIRTVNDLDNIKKMLK